MKRFIISISAIILFLFIGFIAVFYGGFYIDSDRDDHINTFVRTENKEILIKDKDKWKPFEVRGIDMGSGIPGEWSTDYAITKETYLHWFQLIQEAGANTLRVYSVQNSSFYKAFYEYNSQHEEPLYLLQGISVNDYIQNSRVDAYDDSFAGKLLDNCMVTVDVIHGKRLIINNDADTSTGLYLHDVSKWVLGYIIGNGWEDTTVAYTDEKYPDMEPYKGTYLTASEDASAFESLLAETGDRMLSYESTRYDEQRLISFSSGNATDPFDYPEEIAEYFRKCARIDTEHITATDKFISGQFASYSASPYDQDYFSCMEYATWNSLSDKNIDFSDCITPDGKQNTYRAYLRLLNEHHTMPVLAVDFGAATGRGEIQENQVTSRGLGYYSEKEQGKILVDCYEDIMAAGLSGGCVYSWQDEWFKHSWNTMYAVDLSRNIYWEDAQTNDQHFGLLAFDCGEKESVCYVDGDTSEWTDKDRVIQYEDGSFISVKYDASGVYLYLHKKDFDLENDTLYVPIDTTQKTGSTRMENCTAEFERPADFVLVLNGKDNTRLLVQDRYNPIHANYEEDITGEDPYIDPPARDSAVFENICMVLRDVIGQYQDAATPLKTFESGKLYYGNGNPSASAYDSRADFICNGDDVEIRIPWQLLNFSDPSRMQIHDDYYDGNYGIESVGIKEMFIGFGGEGNTIEMGGLKLKGWENTVSCHERLKEAYQVLKTYWTGKEYE